MSGGRSVHENGPVMNGLLDRLWAPTGPPPRPTVRGQVFDAVLALVLCVAAVEYAINPPDLPDVPIIPGVPRRPFPVEQDEWRGTVLPALLASGLLAVRRRYPLTVLWTVVLATVLTPHESPRLTFYACVIAVYSAAAYSQYRLPTMAGVAAAVLSVSAFRDSVLPIVPHDYIALMILVPIAMAANGMRTWKLRTDAGLAQVSALEREQTEALRRAVEHERARIARELHDVVTHNVSVMVIQAGAARKVMDADPDQARGALLAVEAGGRAAMSELRHVMGLLTVDGPADLAPQPGLDQIQALVARVRDTGVPVGLTVAGTPRPLPSGVELAAYRVVQEALTNTVKHATGASAAVVVEYDAERLRVEVTDTGGEPGAASTGDGRGLIGLRERLAVYRGTLHAGPRAGGGYRVLTEIPLEAS
ncbi:sensor histidine kinase [Actinosynnema sp. CS-041913]|uniref:sensor histidine kinase n=1 Tax=Actinosynnema sp. CS-041913 TaxID=3239917 RepID=UPI003D8B742A